MILFCFQIITASCERSLSLIQQVLNIYTCSVMTLLLQKSGPKFLKFVFLISGTFSSKYCFRFIFTRRTKSGKQRALFANVML